jgi:hypothetical protein
MFSPKVPAAVLDPRLIRSPLLSVADCCTRNTQLAALQPGDVSEPDSIPDVPLCWVDTACGGPVTTWRGCSWLSVAIRASRKVQ